MTVLSVHLLLFFLSLLGISSAQQKTTYTNWAGAKIDIPNNDAKSLAISKAVAVWTVPKICLPPGGKLANNYYLAAWVGFAGNGCSNTQGALAQAGIILQLKLDGATAAKAWVEWLPKMAEFKENIQINPGDEVAVTVEATSNSAGKVTIENRSTKKNIVETIQSPNLSDPASNLCNGNGTAYAFIEKTGVASNTLPKFADISFGDFEVTTKKTQQTVNINSPAAALCDMKNGDTFATAERIPFSNTGFRVRSSKGSCPK